LQEYPIFGCADIGNLPVTLALVTKRWLQKGDGYV
jgi:hypothetical protein